MLGKTRKIKEVQEKRTKKSLLKKKLLAFSITLAAIIILGTVLYQLIWRTPEGEVKFPFKAAIIDQLGKSFPIQSFRENVTSLLVNKNFTFTYSCSEEVTVEFFRNLPKSNCGLYILRVHSTVRNNTDLVDFFTNEPYQENKYEEYGDRLSVGWYQWAPDQKYFAIGPQFVEIMDGTFPKSIVIAMGCKSLKYSTMAQAFLKKGAQLYVGWTDDVDAYDSDKITFRLLELLFKYNKTISEAVKECNNLPRQYPGKLDYFPKDFGNKKMSDLIHVSASQAHDMLNSREQILISTAIRKDDDLERPD